MTLHNFIRVDVLEDSDFEWNVQNASLHPTQANIDDGSATRDDVDMGALRDATATAMVSWFSVLRI
jgi:hypothetical protein